LHREVYTLGFNGHAVFHQSTVKRPPFNEVTSLDAPQVSTVYGAFLQCASMMNEDPFVLDEVCISIRPPTPAWSPTRNMLIHTAPLSPYDWQSKWVNRKGEYVPNLRVYPRRVYALWQPRYKLEVFTATERARRFVSAAFRILADRADGRIGANVGLGYKKKLFGTFDVQTEEQQALARQDLEGKPRVCEVVSDCPTRFNAVVPLHVEVRTVTLRHVHPPPRVERVSHVGVYAPGSTVLLKSAETKVDWYALTDKKTGRRTGDIVGISGLIEHRYFGDRMVKALQGVFLSHESEVAKGAQAWSSSMV